MSHKQKRYAFINDSQMVVQVIVGDLDDSLLAMFVEQYAGMFGAVWALEVADESVQIWMGGRYDSHSGFLRPPEPEIVEGASEVVEEPVAMIEETSQEPQPEPEV
jgi:hypothetical protein